MNFTQTTFAGESSNIDIALLHRQIINQLQPEDNSFSDKLKMALHHLLDVRETPVLSTQNELKDTDDTVAQMDTYLESLEKSIENIITRPERNDLTYDILDTEKSKKNKLISLKEKQRQMKIGEIWQEALGSYEGCINLKVGHETGLDIISHTRKFAIELKNRTNTDNASSKKSNLDKLARFKRNYPDYKCIYANINADTEEKTRDSPIKKIIHDGVELEHHIGYNFLQFVLGEDTDDIIDFVKNTIDKYT
jgi:hypothetical protein